MSLVEPMNQQRNIILCIYTFRWDRVGENSLVRLFYMLFLLHNDNQVYTNQEFAAERQRNGTIRLRAEAYRSGNGSKIVFASYYYSTSVQIIDNTRTYWWMWSNNICCRYNIKYYYYHFKLHPKQFVLFICTDFVFCRTF